jgi:hypothetical protein
MSGRTGVKSGLNKYQRYYRTPRGRFAQHKANATRRGIQFLFTFEEWWSLWEPHWERRGIAGLVMSRPGDVGPYALHNVQIVPAGANHREAVIKVNEKRYGLQ